MKYLQCLAVVLFSVSPAVANEPLKIKGFYVGMRWVAALNNIPAKYQARKRHLEDQDVDVKNEAKSAGHDVVTIVDSQSGTVGTLWFENDVLMEFKLGTELFDAEALSIPEFQESVSKNYHLVPLCTNSGVFRVCVAVGPAGEKVNISDTIDVRSWGQIKPVLPSFD